MKKIGLLCAVLVVFAFKNAAWQSGLLYVNPNQSITYSPDEKGNTIPDFSRVGYHQGDALIPNVAVAKMLSPSKTGDDQQLIQQAIDELSKKTPDKKGLRGTILLKKGVYKIPGTLRVNAGGIVLRGEGDHESGTRLIASGKGQRTLIQFSGTGRLKEIPGSRVKISDRYVPVGTMTFELESSAGFKAGDQVVVFRPGTEKWISDIRMDKIEEKEDVLKQWQPAEYDLHFERRIVKVEGNKITIDNPVVMAMEEQYGGGAVYKASFTGRIAENGIENMAFESEYASDTDEDHGWIAVQFNRAENCWVRNVTSRYFGYSCVSLEDFSKNITVRDSKCFDAKSIITGGRRYSFNNTGQLNLFMNLETTEGRHDYVTGAKTLGPNVFFNCRASRTHADIGPHHRWAVGTLYDQIVTDGEINVQDRGNWGTGHGWAGVTQVVWNCKAKRAAVQSPWASGYNYCIGLQGEKYSGRLKGRPDGVWEGQNKDGLIPESLYTAQLNARQKK